MLVLLCLLSLGGVHAQFNPFQLPNVRSVPKPQVPRELLPYFDLEGSARTFVDTLIGPRPGGIFPEKTWDVQGNTFGSNGGLSGVPPQNLLNQAAINGQLPPGFGQGLSFSGTGAQPGFGQGGFSGSGAQPGFQSSISQPPRQVSPTVNGSSIGGIPNIYPNLPKAPVPQSQVASELPQIPQLPSAPEVPQGGLGPLTQNANFGIESPPPPASGVPQFPFGASVPQSQAPTAQGGQGNLLGGLLGLIGLNNLGQNQAVQGIQNLLGYGPPTAGQQQQPGTGSGGQGVISSVLYNTLTDGVVQKPTQNDSTNGTDLAKTAVETLGSNVQLVQQLLSQPNSPFCNPKPVPVSQFDVDAFMGSWYQVLYSPPLSPGPCSMIAYKKLADVANGGPGTVFDTFEYTTEGTPYGRPRISSGYAIIRAPGQLIYRTTSNPNDVNVHVIDVGPMNEFGQYEYAILSVNCNYPLHVFARDPIRYKQKYEGRVNALLEQKGLINGFSRLLNVIAPVDSTLCNFPPTLFNIQG